MTGLLVHIRVHEYTEFMLTSLSRVLKLITKDLSETVHERFLAYPKTLEDLDLGDEDSPEGAPPRVGLVARGASPKHAAWHLFLKENVKGHPNLNQRSYLRILIMVKLLLLRYKTFCFINFHMLKC